MAETKEQSQENTEKKDKMVKEQKAEEKHSEEKNVEEVEKEKKVEKTKNPLEFKLFGLYDVSEIKVVDPGMKRYINLEPKLVVKSQGRIREKFGKRKINLIEIFANLVGVPGHRGKKHKIMTGHKTGKYSQNIKIVLDCLKIIKEKTNENPIQVFVTGLENSAPRDGTTIIEYGGARYPQAVDMSPLRRVTMTLRTIIHGSYDKAFKNKVPIENALAEEIIKAYSNEADSHAIAKRNDSEKQADSAR